MAAISVADAIPVRDDAGIPSALNAGKLLSFIWQKRESRNLLLFIIALAFMGIVQACYAFTVDSLGLLSDAFHMLFHCLALCIGLGGMIYSKRPRTLEFSYGYERYEVLAAFSNSLLLIFVVMYVIGGAAHRLLESGHHGSDKHDIYSTEFGFIGLALNVVGVAMLGPIASGFDHVQRYNLTHSKSAAAKPVFHAQMNKRQVTFGSSGWSGLNDTAAGGATTVGTGAFLPARTPTRGTLQSGHGSNVNSMMLHVYSDAISSLAVIIASFLVRKYGMGWVDTIQAIAVSTFTLYLVIPLFKATGAILLQTTPTQLHTSLLRCRQEAKVVQGVLSIEEERFWTQAPGYYIGSAVVLVSRKADVQHVIQAVSRIYGAVLDDFTVQVEKDAPLLSPPARDMHNRGADAGHSHDCGSHGHSHGHDTHDHGHGHGSQDHTGGDSNAHGHSHGGHDDHGHSHGGHDDHGHSHGGHDDHGHSHGGHDDHGHSHGGHDDHGHSHGGHDDHDNNRDTHGHSHSHGHGSCDHEHESHGHSHQHAGSLPHAPSGDLHARRGASTHSQAENRSSHSHSHEHGHSHDHPHAH